MRYRFSIPLMFLISGASAWLGWVLDFNVMATVVVTSAVLFALDSRVVGAARYRGTMGQPPSAVAIVTLLVWPLAFPMYLALRRKISQGEAVQRTESDDRISVGWTIAISVLGLAILAGVLLLGPRLRNARDLQAIAAQVAMTGVGVNLTPGQVTVSVPAGIAGDTLTQRQVAENIGRNLLWDSRQGALLGDITVQYVAVEERGSVVSSRVVASYTWTSAELIEEQRTRTKGRFTLDFTNFPVLTDGCRAEGVYDLWSGASETIGHATGGVTCPGETDEYPQVSAYLRLSQAAGEQVGFLGLGLFAPEAHELPCTTFDQCVCPIILESTEFSVTLNCNLGSTRGFVALRFVRDENGAL